MHARKNPTIGTPVMRVFPLRTTFCVALAVAAILVIVVVIVLNIEEAGNETLSIIRLAYIAEDGGFWMALRHAEQQLRIFWLPIVAAAFLWDVIMHPAATVFQIVSICVGVIVGVILQGGTDGFMNYLHAAMMYVKELGLSEK